jgi:hypothetical protein
MNAVYGFAEKWSYGQYGYLVQFLLFVAGKCVSNDNLFNRGFGYSLNSWAGKYRVRAAGINFSSTVFQKCLYGADQ